MDLLPVGTIVRAYSNVEDAPPWLAVVVPFERMTEMWWDADACVVAATLPITDPTLDGAISSIESHGAWIIGNDGDVDWQYDIIDDADVPPEAEALAGRILLDPSFMPFVNDLNE